jgi:CubicO group peptidase (beta-lactamase class C family)
MRPAPLSLLALSLALSAGCSGFSAPPAPPLTDELGLSEMVAAIKGGGYRKVEAVLVQVGGRVVFEDYYGRTGPETRVDPRSASKSITALVLGQAIEDGFIESVDAPLFSFFGDREPIAHDGPVKRAVTLEDALTMSSALDCDDWEDSPGNEERMYRSKSWTRFALDIPVDPAYEREADTGRGRFSYCTAGVYLLGRVVEEATGEPFEDYVRRKLFEPLGITDPVWPRSPEGKVQTGGGLRLRARDFAALGELVLDGLLRPAGDDPLVSRDWTRRMLQPYRKATPRDAYGYLWWMRDFRRQGDPTPYPGFYMSGNGGNKAVVLPDLDAVVVILSTNYNTRGMHDQTSELLEKYVLPALVDR